MDATIAVIGIIVRDLDVIRELNEILSSYDQYIVGRMGLPHQKMELRVISIVMDAPVDIIGFFAGKVANLNGVEVNTVYA